MSSKSTSAMALLAANRYEAHSDNPTVRRRQKLNTKSTYEDNFDFAFSFYQPMIEYLDKKLSGLTMKSDDLPHLPFLNERGLERNRGSFRERTTGKDRREPMRRSYNERDFRQLMESKGDTFPRQWLQGKLDDSKSGASLQGTSSGSSRMTMGNVNSSGSSLSGQYSLSKRTIRRSITSKSELGSDYLSTPGASPSLASSPLDERNRQKHVSFATPSAIKRSRSFGAFTEKAARDVENQLHADVLQNIASKYRTVVKATTKTPVKKQLPPQSPTRYSANDSMESFKQQKSVQFDEDFDNMNLTPISTEIQVDTSNNDFAYWKDMW